ncbi:MAG TPA: 23S rRNA (guanosine(2251)-2'-O)-methyltransferase RlmB [Burkholderiaceae bacterium]|nr:23S rRNA (guanosine(2251)-2'-O)-methyltransferase RlmB [Burkholderiaceae bacterium]
MLVFGFHSVGSRLRRSAGSVKELYVDARRDDGRMRELLAVAKEAGVEARRVDGARLDRLCPNRRHQGVVAIAEAQPPAVGFDELLDRIEGPPLLLLLDGVTDPRNLGACLRVADGVGAHGVIAPKDHACPLNEAAIQTASGAAESVPYVMVTNLARTIDDLQERGVAVIGTADEADRTLYDVEVPAAVAWVLGAEGVGLRRLTRERCDALVSIPMVGQVSSLNVSVAAGVVLYETLRRTRLGAAAAG